MRFRGPGDSVAGAAGFSPSHSWERNGQGNGLRLSPQHPPAPSNSKSPADVWLVRRTWRWDPATSRGEGEGRGGAVRIFAWKLHLFPGSLLGFKFVRRRDDGDPLGGPRARRWAALRPSVGRTVRSDRLPGRSEARGDFPFTQVSANTSGTGQPMGADEREGGFVPRASGVAVGLGRGVVNKSYKDAGATPEFTSPAQRVRLHAGKEGGEPRMVP